VTLFADVETFATVHHMTSEVRATVRDGVGLADLLRATFPGGSITGAPKIRAMELLEDLETTERGPYTGAIGFFNGNDSLELSIAIRTAVASGNRALYATGGGVVADSDVDREWNETEWKVAALRRALAPASSADPAAASDIAAHDIAAHGASATGPRSDATADPAADPRPEPAARPPRTSGEKG
jgi:anthranilate/para-aminobenzoate synthase component I